MNAIERIQAAIDKLEALKADSVAGEWGATGGHDSGSVIVWTTDGVGPFTHLFEDLQYGQHAELIITLHRTIDAQLAILTHGLARAEAKVLHGGKPEAVWSNERDMLSLADAILGGAK